MDKYLFFKNYFYTTIFNPIKLSITNNKQKGELWNHNAKKFLNNLKIKRKVIGSNSLIEKGYILSNHRSWFDFVYDPYYTKSSVLGRRGAFFAVTLAAKLLYDDGRMISFNRKNTTSREIFEKIKNHIIANKGKYSNRVLFFPEGTRKTYTNLNSPEDIKQQLKLGLLKRIYEDPLSLPVQLYISSGKDYPMNQKKFSVKKNIKIISQLSKSIEPSKYKTFDTFINSICKEWYTLYKNTHTSL